MMRVCWKLLRLLARFRNWLRLSLQSEFQMEPYSDSIEHLRDEIARLDLLLRRAILLARPASPEAGADDFRGLVVTEHEIDEVLLTKDLLGDRWERAAAKKPELDRVDEELNRRRKEIDERREQSRQHHIYLTLPALAAKFDLSPAEVDILLIALAPELEPRYETLYAYLQNDVTRKHPSINLALNLICRSEREKLSARQIFSPLAALLRHHILELGEESQDRQPSLIRRFLKIDESVVGFLLDFPIGPGHKLSWITPRAIGDELEVEPATLERLQNLALYLIGADLKEPPVIRLIGDTESSLRDAAEILCSMLNRQMLFADLSQIGGDKSGLAGLMRDAHLWNGVLAILDLEATPSGEAQSAQPRSAEASFWSQLQTSQGLVLLLGPVSAFPQTPIEISVWRVEVRPLCFNSRQRTWETLLGERAEDLDTARLADNFQFSGRQIQQTISAAYGLATLRNPSRPFLLPRISWTPGGLSPHRRSDVSQSE